MATVGTVLWVPFCPYLNSPCLHTLGETENEWQKTEQVPILLLRGARSFFDTKKMKKKNASLDIGDNPIYPISNSGGQDCEG
jgi:hypothetical protein